MRDIYRRERERDGCIERGKERDRDCMYGRGRRREIRSRRLRKTGEKEIGKVWGAIHETHIEVYIYRKRGIEKLGESHRKTKIVKKRE